MLPCQFYPHAIGPKRTLSWLMPSYYRTLVTYFRGRYKLGWNRFHQKICQGRFFNIIWCVAQKQHPRMKAPPFVERIKVQVSFAATQSSIVVYLLYSTLIPVHFSVTRCNLTWRGTKWEIITYWWFHSKLVKKSEKIIERVAFSWKM